MCSFHSLQQEWSVHGHSFQLTLFSLASDDGTGSLTVPGQPHTACSFLVAFATDALTTTVLAGLFLPFWGWCSVHPVGLLLSQQSLIVVSPISFGQPSKCKLICLYYYLVVLMCLDLGCTNTSSANPFPIQREGVHNKIILFTEGAC